MNSSSRPFGAEDHYVIAEVGVNHEGSLEKAIQLIDAAKLGGADAVKFQTYKAPLIAMKESPAYWDTSEEHARTQFELFSRYDALGPSDYERLAAHCARQNIDFMSTPFDLDAVRLLSPLVSVFKVASADITNVPLLRAVGQTGKPVILSTGASEIPEISEAVRQLQGAGAAEVTLLHCILAYPTPEFQANLRMISSLIANFPDHAIGYSDHTRSVEDNLPLTLAYGLGARVFEKHFTLDKTLPGNDHYHSMDLADLRRLVSQLARSKALLGAELAKRSVDAEQLARVYARRGICVVRDLPVGHKVTEADLICLRPVSGVPAESWDRVVGETLSRAVCAGQALNASDLVGFE